MVLLPMAFGGKSEVGMIKEALNTNKIIAVVGPTASGKSGLGIKIAQRLQGEIISADSMQIYKGMNIGTAKISTLEMKGIPHHLIDIKSPQESFSVAEFQFLARQKVQDIFKRNKTPILVGGTGLYLYSVIDPYDFSRSKDEPMNPIRQTYQNIAQSQGKEKNHLELQKVDPVSAQKLHPNDEKRVIRALEYFQLNGKPISENQQAFQQPQSLYPVFLIGLNTERSLLYQGIEKRVDAMMAEGLLDEVKSLLQSGCLPQSQAMQGIGYRQLIQYLQGTLTMDAAIALIKQESRRYAKRQLTWFRRDPRIHWYDSFQIQDSLEFEHMFSALNVYD